jgi:DNA-binding response OmpR family regulator
MKILIAEDDPNTRNGLVEIAANEGYATVSADNGRAALKLFWEESPDVVCLDIMMPEINGYDVCREIRKTNLYVPVLFISAKSEEIDTVLGLELGADDFIIKPFGVKEVVARIRAVTRRYLKNQSHENNPALDEFVIADLRIVPEELRAFREDEVIELGLRDVKILKLLAENIGKALKRNEIFDHCWGLDYYPSSRTLDQHISQLRKRIERDPHDPKIIKTVHGVGYRHEK